MSDGRRHGLRARAEIAKARGDRARALADFEAFAALVDDAGARLELCKLYEHYVKAPADALAIARQGTSEPKERALRRTRRLEAKLARSAQSHLFEPRGRRRPTACDAAASTPDADGPFQAKREIR